MIVVFDAHCLLCSGSVQFLLKHDHQRVFRFASMQSPAGEVILAKAGLKPEGLQTFLLSDGEHAYQQTAALFRVAHELGYPWRLAWIGWIVPAPIRDALYRWVARNRFRFFGRLEACFLPRPEDRDRFLD